MAKPESTLSDRNMVVVTRVGDYWVNDAQASRITQILETNKKGMIKLEASYIAIQAIDAVLSPTDYEVMNHRRKGDWQCKWRYWHERDNKCAHERFHK